VIQAPQPGDLIAEIPGKGPLLTWAPQISAMFGGLLAEGRVIESGGVRSIEWKVDGMHRLGPDDGRVRTAAERLRTAIASMRELAVQLDEQLRAQPDAERIRVGAAQVKALGGAERDAILARPEVEHYRAMASLAAEAVDRALRRSEFVGDGTRLRLVGWGFLPAQGAQASARPALKVRLERRPDETSDGCQIVVLRWAVAGEASGVELRSCVPGATSMRSVPATATTVTADPASGTWRFPAESFPPGTVVRAMATAPGAVAQSTELRIGELPAPADAAPVARLPEVAVQDLPEIEALRTGPTSETLPVERRTPIGYRPLLAAAGVALLLALVTAWLLVPAWFPPTPVVARVPALYVTRHVPPLPGATAPPKPLPGTLAPLPAPPTDGGVSEANGVASAPAVGRATAGAGRSVEADGAPGGRRFAEFRTDRSARSAERVPPTRQPRVVPEFRTGLSDFAPMADRSRLDGDPDAVLAFSPEASAFRIGTSPIQALVGIEVADASKSLDEWAVARGLRSIPVGKARILLLDGPDGAMPSSEWTESARKIAIGPGRLAVWGMNIALVIAVVGAPDGCSAQLLGSDQLVLASRIPESIAIDGKPMLLWRVRALAGADGGDFQLSACDSSVRSIPMNLKGQVREVEGKR